MYVKLVDGQPVKYPYSLTELYRDNPQTSFPQNVSNDTLESYGVYPVQLVPAPQFDNKTHRMTQSVQLIDNVWTQCWEATELSNGEASILVRHYRNNLLSETDWMALSDNVMTPEWINYRKALRDITSQEGFPHNVVWPVSP